MRWGGVIVAMAAGMLAMAGPPSSPTFAQAHHAGSCDRACLESMVDRYLAALVGHDPSKAPLAADARFTENGQALRVGDGLWGTIDALGGYRLFADDPQSGQVGFFGTIKESGRPAILALRLKVGGGRIHEVETLVARSSGGPNEMLRANDLVDKPIFHQVLAPGERRSRAELVSIANSYFEGLEHATAKLTPFDPNCTRIENGMVTANNPQGPGAMQRMTCGAQFETGFSTFITQVRGRRYPVVDVERGLVLAFVDFDHAGRIKDVKLSDGSNLHVPPPFDAPYSFQIAELFKIVDGKIARVEAVLLTVPYHMPSGWPS
jgi:hypothetical protein